MLAGLVKAPSAYDPASARPAAAKDRRNYVIDQMAEHGFVSRRGRGAATARTDRLNVYEPPNDCVSVAPEVNNWGFFCDFFKSWWMQQPAFGANPQERLDKLRRGGYKIVTTLDPKLQTDGDEARADKEKIEQQLRARRRLIEPGTGRVKAMAVNRIYSLDQSAQRPAHRPGQARPGPGNYPNTVNPLLGGGDMPGYQAGSTFKMFTHAGRAGRGHAADAPRSTRPQQLVSSNTWHEPGGAAPAATAGARRTPAAP